MFDFSKFTKPAKSTRNLTCMNFNVRIKFTDISSEIYMTVTLSVNLSICMVIFMLGVIIYL